KSAQIREILINESAWEEMTCLFAPSLKVRLQARQSRIVRSGFFLRGIGLFLPVMWWTGR
ncbi:hypothetical protein CEG99_00630, partial [Shigella boydii]